ncbi:competence protein CoiA [Brevibacillus agri]|uniref:competence protein CoiA n=1 Tax=Brevibacillus agri TaxID=51101 RepID=UPI001EE4ED6E|nr:competence protein CoiA family protein [Brevibacillus agri]MCG5254324.1 competence protein CoiA [Brevibacillus agri]MDN4094701.1 competence protein CoiA family protein [Brevibacillus agri]MED1821922.1 competence protein CoiA family protein [Brevibacillus agri]
MRQCVHGEGFSVDPQTHSPELLRTWSGKQLFCQQCGAKVIFRRGQRVAPHFAHVASSCCDAGEPETAEHKAGKQLLVEWVRELYPANHTRQEAYLEEIGQRADVLTIFPNGQRLCIEYQCSRIEDKALRKRIEGYDQAQIAQIWIIGKSVFASRSVNRFRLQAWEKTIWERQRLLCLLDPLGRKRLDVLLDLAAVAGAKTLFSCKRRAEWELSRLKLTPEAQLLQADDAPLAAEKTRQSPQAQKTSRRRATRGKAALAHKKTEREREREFLAHPLRKFALARVGDYLSHPLFNQKLEGDQLFVIDHRLWQSYLFLTEIHKVYQRKAVFATGTEIPRLFIKHILTKDDRFFERPFRSVVTRYVDQRLAQTIRRPNERESPGKAVHELVYEYFCRLEALGFLRNTTPNKERISASGMLYGRFDVLFDRFCPDLFGHTERELVAFFRQHDLCYLKGRWFDKKQTRKTPLDV